MFRVLEFRSPKKRSDGELAVPQLKAADQRFIDQTFEYDHCTLDSTPGSSIR